MDVPAPKLSRVASLKALVVELTGLVIIVIGVVVIVAVITLIVTIGVLLSPWWLLGLSVWLQNPASFDYLTVTTILCVVLSVVAIVVTLSWLGKQKELMTQDDSRTALDDGRPL